MATSGEIQKASIESEINLANLANADLLCQLCKIFTVQMGSNPSDDSRVWQKCLQENLFPTQVSPNISQNMLVLVRGNIMHIDLGQQKLSLIQFLNKKKPNFEPKMMLMLRIK